MHPTPLFSSQYTGLPSAVLALASVIQSLPLRFGPEKLPDTRQTSNPKLLVKQLDWVRLTTPSNRLLEK